MHLSLQANRFRRRRLEHLTSRFFLETALKGSLGTAVMPVLSQMILDREEDLRAALWLGLKTPWFSYHSLIVSDTRREGDEHQQRLHLKWIQVCDWSVCGEINWHFKWCWRCYCRTRTARTVCSRLQRTECVFFCHADKKNLKHFRVYCRPSQMQLLASIKYLTEIVLGVVMCNNHYSKSVSQSFHSLVPLQTFRLQLCTPPSHLCRW